MLMHFMVVGALGECSQRIFRETRSLGPDEALWLGQQPISPSFCRNVNPLRKQSRVASLPYIMDLLDVVKMFVDLCCNVGYLSDTI